MANAKTSKNIFGTRTHSLHTHIEFTNRIHFFSFNDSDIIFTTREHSDFDAFFLFGD